MVTYTQSIHAKKTVWETKRASVLRDHTDSMPNQATRRNRKAKGLPTYLSLPPTRHVSWEVSTVYINKPAKDEFERFLNSVCRSRKPRVAWEELYHMNMGAANTYILTQAPPPDKTTRILESFQLFPGTCMFCCDKRKLYIHEGANGTCAPCSCVES